MYYMTSPQNHSGHLTEIRYLLGKGKKSPLIKSSLTIFVHLLTQSIHLVFPRFRFRTPEKKELLPLKEKTD